LSTPTHNGATTSATTATLGRPTLIANVKRNSLDDGPGIRSVVFFKGCPLRCAWCQNPETLSTRAEIQRSGDLCTRCEACVDVCPVHVARPGTDAQDASGCQRCGRCVEACTPRARRLVGTPANVEDLARLLARDAPFYRRSGGGVTLSGGEPTVHAHLAGRLAARLDEAGIPVLLETCGLFGWTPFERHLLPHISTVYFDLKLADDHRHREATGHSNRRILQNLRRLVARTIDLLVRVPLVPGLTDDAENLTAIARHLRSLGLDRLALLPYNPLWIPKRQGLAAGGRGLHYAHDRWMSEKDVARCADLIRAEGLEVSP
jgi:pyruvate formate lyase activating enzyme